MKFGRKIENVGFQKFYQKNRKFRKPKFWKKYVQEYFFAEMIFLSRFFSTVWTKSLDSQKTVQSTRGSSSMPRQGIAFRGCV